MKRKLKCLIMPHCCFCVLLALIMLDMEERDMPGIAYRLVEEMANKNLIRSEESPLLMRALLLKHKHVQELGGGWFGLRRINTSAVSLQVVCLHNFYFRG